MSDIKSVIFNMYGTLFYLAKESKPYYRLFLELGLQEPEEFKRARRIALTQNFENLTDLVKEIKPDALINISSYEQEIKREIASAQMYPETISVLERLKQRGIKIGSISNLATPYKQTFFDLGLAKYFDDVSFSFDVGLKKPEKEIYTLMLERLGVEPSLALMTGDKKIADVCGPRCAGINAVHLDRKNRSAKSIWTLDGVFSYL